MTRAKIRPVTCWMLGADHVVLELDPWPTGHALELHWVRVGPHTVACWPDEWGRWLYDVRVGQS